MNIPLASLIYCTTDTHRQTHSAESERSCRVVRAYYLCVLLGIGGVVVVVGAFFIVCKSSLRSKFLIVSSRR